MPVIKDIKERKNMATDSNNKRQTSVLARLFPCLMICRARETLVNMDNTSCGRHSEILGRLRANLLLYMDTDHGLFDELLRLRVITPDQLCQILREPTNTCRVAHLLTLVSAMPDDKQEQFLAALDNNRQTHIAEYIRVKGSLSCMVKDSWNCKLATR
jgi:Caspase recruitment domain